MVTKGKTASVPVQVPKRGNDDTRTERQVAHLARLELAKGKRVVADLDAPAVAALQALLKGGYAQTQVAAIRRALIDAAAENLNQSLDVVYINGKNQSIELKK